MHGICIRCNRARRDEYLKYTTFAIHIHETHLYILHFYITIKTHTQKNMNPIETDICICHFRPFGGKGGVWSVKL